MKRSQKSLALFTVILVASAIFFVVSPLTPNVRAQSSPTISISPAIQPSAAVGFSVALSVNFTNLPTFSGWDISVKTNAAVLKPIAIGNFDPALGSVSEFTHCLNGVGSGCTSTDGLGVAHSAATALGGSDVGNGTLFSITYRVVGLQGSSVTFSASSVTDPTGATVIDCSATPGQCLSGLYGSLLSVDFSFPRSIQIGQLASFNSTVSGLRNTPPYSYSWTFGDGGTSNATSPSHVYSQAGSFNVTLMVTDSSNPPLVSTVHHIVNVLAPDFHITAASVGTLPPGKTGTSIIRIDAISRFNGTITIALAPPHGLTVSLDANNITLNAAISSQNVALNVTSNIPGTYQIGVTGLSPGLSPHGATATINVSDFALTASSSTIQSLSNGGTTTIKVSSLFGFPGNVSLSLTTSAGLIAMIAPSSIVASGTAVLTVSGSPGVYSVLVTGSAPGYQPHTVSVKVELGIDFNVKVIPIGGPIAPNTQGISAVTVRSLNGFSGTISLSFIPSAGLAFSVDSTSITLGSGATGKTTFTVSASVPGNYNLTVIASSRGLSHTSQITIVVSKVKNHSVAVGATSLRDVLSEVIAPLRSFWMLSGLSVLLALVFSILIIKRKKKMN